MSNQCCDELGCVRKQPVLLRPGPWGDGWYVITKYTRTKREGKSDLIRAEIKHKLDDETCATLDLWRTAASLDEVVDIV
jgi:hypothetical protein